MLYKENLLFDKYKWSVYETTKTLVIIQTEHLREAV